VKFWFLFKKGKAFIFLVLNKYTFINLTLAIFDELVTPIVEAERPNDSEEASASAFASGFHP
jgi:hypothetical protein